MKIRAHMYATFIISFLLCLHMCIYVYMYIYKHTYIHTCIIFGSIKTLIKINITVKSLAILSKKIKERSQQLAIE